MEVSEQLDKIEGYFVTYKQLREPNCISRAGLERVVYRHNPNPENKMKMISNPSDDKIISERRLLRISPLTEQDLDDAVEDKKITIVASESGARFYPVSQVEELLHSLGYDENDRGRKRRRPTDDEGDGEDDDADDGEAGNDEDEAH